MSDNDCLFCRIICKEIKSAVVYEDQDVFAFKDINPQAPVHILVIPKKHIKATADLTEADKEIVGKIHLVCRDLAKQNKIENGYRIVANSGPDAGQSVFHLHFHLLGGRKFSWPPG